MEAGLHIGAQRQVVKYLRDRLRRQLWAMGGLVVGAAAGIVLLLGLGRGNHSLAVAEIHGPGVSGSGFLVGSQLVLTTARVVGNQPQVTLTFRRGPSVEGRVVFVDASADLAMIEIQGLEAQLEPLPLGNSDAVAPGERIYVVGFLAGLYATSRGVVTSRTGEIFQLGLAAHPGHSGAPLMREADDTVVGMVLSTVELGGADSGGRHRALALSAIERLCAARGRPIR